MIGLEWKNDEFTNTIIHMIHGSDTTYIDILNPKNFILRYPLILIDNKSCKLLNVQT